MEISSKKRTRRNFITEAIIGWFILMLLPFIYGIFKYVIPPKINEHILGSINAAKLSDVTSATPKLVRFNKKPVILLQNEKGQIKALSAVCTHLGCIVEYQPEQKNFHCNCHGSVFDSDGKNISGPAPRPLDPYKVEIKSGDIIISKLS